MTDDKNRLLVHTITNARLVDVSFVKDPANPHAYIEYSAIPENFPVYHGAWKKANEAFKASLQSLQSRKIRKKRKRGRKPTFIRINEWFGE